MGRGNRNSQPGPSLSPGPEEGERSMDGRKKGTSRRKAREGPGPRPAPARRDVAAGDLRTRPGSWGASGRVHTSGPPALADPFQGHYQGPWALKQLPRLAVRSRSLQQEWPPGAHCRANTGAPPLPVRQAQPCSWQDPGPPSGLLSHSPPADSPPRFLFHPQLLPLLRRGTHIAKPCLGPTSCTQHSSPPGDVHPEDQSTHHGKRPTDTPGSQGHVGRRGPGDLQTSLEAGARPLAHRLLSPLRTATEGIW